MLAKQKIKLLFFLSFIYLFFHLEITFSCLLILLYSGGLLLQGESQEEQQKRLRCTGLQGVVHQIDEAQNYFISATKLRRAFSYELCLKTKTEKNKKNKKLMDRLRRCETNAIVCNVYLSQSKCKCVKLFQFYVYRSLACLNT